LFYDDNIQPCKLCFILIISLVAENVEPIEASIQKPAYMI